MGGDHAARTDCPDYRLTGGNGLCGPMASRSRLFHSNQPEGPRFGTHPSAFHSQECSPSATSPGTPTLIWRHPSESGSPRYSTSTQASPRRTQILLRSAFSERPFTQRLMNARSYCDFRSAPGDTVAHSLRTSRSIFRGISTAMRRVRPNPVSGNRRCTAFQPPSKPGGKRKLASQAPSSSCFTHSAGTPKPPTSKRSYSRVTHSRCVRNQQVMYSSLRVEKFTPKFLAWTTASSSGASCSVSSGTGSHFR